MVQNQIEYYFSSSFTVYNYNINIVKTNHWCGDLYSSTSSIRTISFKQNQHWATDSFKIISTKAIYTDLRHIGNCGKKFIHLILFRNYYYSSIINFIQRCYDLRIKLIVIIRRRACARSVDLIRGAKRLLGGGSLKFSTKADVFNWESLLTEEGASMSIGRLTPRLLPLAPALIRRG